jgi:hypothetical protein
MCPVSHWEKSGEPQKIPVKTPRNRSAIRQGFVLPLRVPVTIMRTLFAGPPGKNTPHAPPTAGCGLRKWRF